MTTKWSQMAPNLKKVDFIGADDSDWMRYNRALGRVDWLEQLTDKSPDEQLTTITSEIESIALDHLPSKPPYKDSKVLKLLTNPKTKIKSPEM